MQAKGIDISTWQGANVNFEKLKADGIQFAILRAGYGKYISQKDDTFETNYAKAKAAGIPVGVYWYSYADGTALAVQEAQICMQAIAGKQFEYPIYLDVEEASQAKLGKTALTNIVDTFCSTLEKAGYVAGYYCNLNWYNNYLDPSKLSKYTLWLAQWQVNAPQAKCDVWQYADNGHPGGISGNVDMNYSYRDFPTEIKAAGKNGFPKGGNTPAPTPKPTKTVAELAKEVIDGKWGNGDDRKKRLTDAGYDYNAVQNEVNKILSTPKKTVAQLADEVLAGKWGNGDDRKNRLTAAGYDYNAVQSEVNKRLSTPKKSNDQIANEVIRGDWGNGATRFQKLKEAGYDPDAIQALVNKKLS